MYNHACTETKTCAHPPHLAARRNELLFVKKWFPHITTHEISNYLKICGYIFLALCEARDGDIVALLLCSIWLLKLLHQLMVLRGCVSLITRE